MVASLASLCGECVARTAQHVGFPSFDIQLPESKTWAVKMIEQAIDSRNRDDNPTTQATSSRRLQVAGPGLTALGCIRRTVEPGLPA